MWMSFPLAAGAADVIIPILFGLFSFAAWIINTVKKSQEEQARLHAGADPVVFLHVMLESAEQERRPQHEQRVGDDRAGDGRLHERVLAGAQGGQRDDQFGQVSQRGVQQPACRIACFGSNGFRGVTQLRGQRHDRRLAPPRGR